MLYFDHSTTAATDPKVMQLRIECGGAAVDAYWYLIEQMHRDECGIATSDAGALRVHCHTLCIDENTLKSWIDRMVSIQLLEADESGDHLISVRAQKNIKAYAGKREKARSAADARWKNADAKRSQKKTQSKRESERNADGMPTKQNKTKGSNAIKGITNPSVVASAAAAEAATATPEPGGPKCPMCGGRMKLFREEELYRCRDSACRATVKMRDYIRGGV